MTSLIVSSAALGVALAAVLLLRRNWLTIARTQRMLAKTDRNLAIVFERRHPDLAAERRQEAERHDSLAVKYARRAWPWKDREDQP